MKKSTNSATSRFAGQSIYLSATAATDEPEVRNNWNVKFLSRTIDCCLTEYNSFDISLNFEIRVMVAQTQKNLYYSSLPRFLTS